MVRNQIEAIVATLPGNCTFLYGTAKEINLKVDGVANGPIVCLYPLQPVNTTLSVNGSANNNFSLYMEFLFQTKFEFASADNETFVQQALALSNTFLIRLRDFREAGSNSRYFNWHNKQNTGKNLPVYNKFDAITTGVSLQFSVATMFNDNLLNC